MLLYFRKNLILSFIIGVISGLPLALGASTLTLILKERNIDIATIGAFAMVGLPYTFKFLWAPLLDNLKIGYISDTLGRRKTQLLIITSLLVVAIVSLGFMQEILQVKYLAFLALSITFLSASNDIVLDAMRVEMLSDADQAAGSSMATSGYRAAMLISSAGSLVIANFLNWQMAYLTMGIVLMSLTAVYMAVYRESNVQQGTASVISISSIFLNPLRDIYRRTNFFYVLGFVVFFKMSDALVTALTSVFLIDIGFTLVDIAFAIKTFGVGATIAGSFLGGYLASKMTLKKFLVLGLLLQMSSNLIYLILFYTGSSMPALLLVATVEYSCSGISSAALIGFISILCNKQFTASQYALLSAFAGFARTTIAGATGLMVSALGWQMFFVITAIASAPSLLLINKATKFK